MPLALIQVLVSDLQTVCQKNRSLYGHFVCFSIFFFLPWGEWSGYVNVGMERSVNSENRAT